MDIVRKEAFVVENVAQALGTRGHAHGLAVLVFVQFDNGVEALFQGVAVCGESDDGEDYSGTFVVWAFAADLEEFGLVSCVDVVAGGGASVAGEDGEVSAGDAEG